MDFEITKKILEPKRPDIGEIELTLFENCHLNCAFCHHDKKSTIGLSREEIFSKLPLVENHLLKLKGMVDVCQINMVGGELFQDRIADWAYEVYYDFLIEIKKLYDEIGHIMKVVWVTSFQFSNRKAVQKLLDNLFYKPTISEKKADDKLFDQIEPNYEAWLNRPKDSDVSIDDVDLIDELKDYRKKIWYNSRKRVKPYEVFTDKQMKEIIETRPTSVDELSDIKKFTQEQIEKYGEDIIAIVSKFK
jgi:hypothetical protein